MGERILKKLTALIVSALTKESANGLDRDDIIHALLTNGIYDEENDILYLKKQRFRELFDEKEIEFLCDIEVDAVEGLDNDRRVTITSEDGEKVRYKCVIISLERLNKKNTEQFETGTYEKLVDKNVKLQTENSFLKKRLRELENIGTVEKKFEQYINQLIDSSSTNITKTPQAELTGKGEEIVDALFLSDLHWDEVVNPKEVEYYNEYNREIAISRLDRVCSQFISFSQTPYHSNVASKIVVMFGGDMVSGNIHEELSRTNETGILETILSLSDHLTSWLCQFSHEYQYVYVPAVVGNHGRISREKIFKGKITWNYDWLVYQLVRKNLIHRGIEYSVGGNVFVDIAESADIEFDVLGTRIRLTHGDQIRSFNGIGGRWPAIFRTDYRKRKGSIRRNKTSYDWLMVGHFHQYGAVDGVLINGSLKGYDEYAYNNNFEPEPPIQAMITISKHYGICNHRPLFADSCEQLEEAENKVKRIF